MKFKILLLSLLFCACNETDPPSLEDNLFIVKNITARNDGRINIMLQADKNTCNFWLSTNAKLIDLGDTLTSVKYTK